MSVSQNYSRNLANSSDSQHSPVYANISDFTSKTINSNNLNQPQSVVRDFNQNPNQPTHQPGIVNYTNNSVNVAESSLTPHNHNVSAYSTPSDRTQYPMGAPSRLLTTKPMRPFGQGYVQSRHLTDANPPSKQPVGSPVSELNQSNLSKPNPSQIKTLRAPDNQSARIPYNMSPVVSSPSSPVSLPQFRSYSNRPLVSGGTLSSVGSEDKIKTPDQVELLTSLLVQNMQASGDPDFYGMCVKCGGSIMGSEHGCRALDQLFHNSCFTCNTCGDRLKSRAFFALEGAPYCESCFKNTLEKCSACNLPITDRMLRATGKAYHTACFVCTACSKNLDGVPFTVDASNNIHCIECFHWKFAPRCCVCKKAIMPEGEGHEAVRIVAMDRSFHLSCYRCEDCGLKLYSEESGRGCYPLDDSLLCKQCNAKRIQALTTNLTTEL